MPHCFHEPPIVQAVKTERILERLLQSGFTTVRDGYGADLALKQAVEDGLICGPRLIICNHAIAKTGGRSGRTTRPDTSLSLGPRAADGPGEVRKAVREQTGSGADFIKALASGPYRSPHSGDPDLSVDELRALVDEAKTAGKYASAHVHDPHSTGMAIEAGVRSIEHGNYLTAELAQRMRDRGVFLVSTIAIGALAVKFGREWGMTPEFIQGKIGAQVERSLEAAALAHRAGVAVAAGSDAFGPMFSCLGMTPAFLVEAGFGHYEALKASTVVNALLFRLDDRIGSIEVGKWADIIVVDGCPDEDAGILAGPENVRLVMKHGNVAKLTL